jgi:thymidylate kinase
MLNIIEGANFVGKTSTMLELKKKMKSYIYVYHPRFNDAQNYEFQYRQKVAMIGNQPGSNFKTFPMHIPRDIIYQISHLVCLKYLESFKEKNILLDRCFISEMCYNELFDVKTYEGFIDVLKTKLDYKVYFLTCEDTEQLKLRIKARLEQDKTKNGFGIRVGDFTADPETVEERFKVQEILTQRYLNVLKQYNLNYQIIDTSHIPQKEVAKLIIKDMKGTSNE